MKFIAKFAFITIDPLYCNCQLYKWTYMCTLSEADFELYNHKTRLLYVKWQRKNAGSAYSSDGADRKVRVV